VPFLRPIDHSEHGHQRFFLAHDVWERLPLRALRITATSALIGVATYGLVGHRGAILHTLRQLQHVRPEWLLLAIAAEVASLTAYALIMHRVLRLGDAHVPVRSLLGMTVVGIAMTSSLPGGGAVSTVYWYQRLRRYGASRPLAAIAMLAAMIIGVVTLIYLTVLGVAIGGGHGFRAAARTPVLIGVGLFLVVRIYCHKQVAAGFRWLARRIAGPDEPIVERRVPAREFALLMSLGYVNWLFDCVALLTALIAVGASVPWQGVLVAYTLGQLAASIPLLPGGGGTVEASLALGLVAYGGTKGGIVAGVILFRLVSAWGLVPLGWALWALSPRRGSSVEVAT
jgi:uncharacterized membrane protein YbhN (UPF0104 family)